MKSPRNISSKTLKCDVAILGGGLAGGLIALALRRKRPELDVLLIEESATLGGNHRDNQTVVEGWYKPW